jgi:hypothetical protein
MKALPDVVPDGSITGEDVRSPLEALIREPYRVALQEREAQ